MQIKYDHVFGLPRKIVWKYLKNAAILKNSIPGCKEFEEISNGIYKGKIEIQIGPMIEVMDVEVHRLKEKFPSYYHLGIKVKGKLVDVDGITELSFKDLKSSSQLTQVAEAKFTSAIAVVGERILGNAAQKNFGKFFQEVERQIRKRLHQQKRG